MVKSFWNHVTDMAVALSCRNSSLDLNEWVSNIIISKTINVILFIYLENTNNWGFFITVFFLFWTIYQFIFHYEIIELENSYQNNQKCFSKLWSVNLFLGLFKNIFLVKVAKHLIKYQISSQSYPYLILDFPFGF